MRLRGIDRGLGIVAIAAFPDAESRIRTLLWRRRLPVAEVSGLELAAVLQALVARGRHGRRAGRYSGQRRAAQRRMAAGQQGLDPDQPGRAHHGLTTGERDFLSRLVRAGSRKVSRDAFYADGADDADSGVTRRRFVDVMISRLRRKATANHMTLPIRAVHGWGYMFAADIKLDLDERAQADDGAEEWRRYGRRERDVILNTIWKGNMRKPGMDPRPEATGRKQAKNAALPRR